jgi:Ni2+-binding GTPase involved in maturation of urease and hydrogenase
LEQKPEIADFILVTGFLGSGKTTLLKQMLANYSAEKRIAIIQMSLPLPASTGRI